MLVQRDDSIIIFADQREQAEAAKELLEIVLEEMAVESNEVGFIIGKGGEQIRELQQMSLCRIDVQRDSNCVKIAGTRAAVNKVLTMLVCHFDLQQYYLKSDGDDNGANNTLKISEAKRRSSPAC